MHTADTPVPVMTRHCDVAVVGGGAAGLAAALQIGRQRRSVIVVDAGEPRNAPAAHMHGYLGHEGHAPTELTAIAREEVRGYGVEVLGDRVTRVTRTDDRHFQIALASGHVIVARRVLIATGVADELPAIEGVAERWGKDVVTCPFCHGFEVRDQRIVQLLTHPAGLHPSPLYRHLSSAFTIVVADGVDADEATLETLRRGGVRVLAGTVGRLVTGADGAITAVELTDGKRIDADAVVISTLFRAKIEAFAPLGLRAQEHPSGLGEFVQADPTGATDVPGLYAAGSVTDPSRQVLPAAADGSRVGAMISMGLADEDLQDAARASGNQADWDHRYSGERMWSGNPNGSLVHEVSPLKPGRALDVGAGEGGDALWLAEQGWQVTASDISERALDRIRAEAEHRALPVHCLHADANGAAPFPPAAFNLVTAHYASIPRTPDNRAVRNLLGAVAPGGILLVVGHDLEPLRNAGADQGHTGHGGHGHSRPFDPDAYVRVEDIAAAIGECADWKIELWEKRPRPAGAASAHHVHDEILRARRLGA